MPGFYTEQTRIVAIDADNSVTIRKLSYGESADLLVRATVPDGDGGVRVDWTTYVMTQTEKSVVSWSGSGFEGREATPENVRALPIRIGRKLARAVTELHEDIGENEGN